MDNYAGESLVNYIEEHFTQPCHKIFPYGKIGHGFCNFVPAFIAFPIVLLPVILLAWCEQRAKTKAAAAAKASAAAKKAE